MNAITETYNGWTNYETWIVNLWLTGEPYAYEMLQHIIEAFDSPGEQASELEHSVMSDCEHDSSMWSDLINAAAHRVNWDEIIEANHA